MPTPTDVIAAAGKIARWCQQGEPQKQMQQILDELQDRGTQDYREQVYLVLIAAQAVLPR